MYSQLGLKSNFIAELSDVQAQFGLGSHARVGISVTEMPELGFDGESRPFHLLVSMATVKLRAILGATHVGISVTEMPELGFDGESRPFHLLVSVATVKLLAILGATHVRISVPEMPELD